MTEEVATEKEIEVSNEDLLNLEEKKESSSAKMEADIAQLRAQHEELSRAYREERARNDSLASMLRKNTKPSYYDDDEEEVTQKKESRKGEDDETEKMKRFYEKMMTGEFLTENEGRINELSKIDPAFFESIKSVIAMDPRKSVELLKKKFKEIDIAKERKRPPAPPQSSIPTGGGVMPSQPTENKSMRLDGFTKKEDYQAIIENMCKRLDSQRNGY